MKDTKTIYEQLGSTYREENDISRTEPCKEVFSSSSWKKISTKRAESF